MASLTAVSNLSCQPQPAATPAAPQQKQQQLQPQNRPRRFLSTRPRNAVLVQGFPGSGKTTLINALVGNRLFPFFLGAVAADEKPSVVWIDVPLSVSGNVQRSIVENALGWKLLRNTQVELFPLPSSGGNSSGGQRRLFRSWSDSRPLQEDPVPPRPVGVAAEAAVFPPLHLPSETASDASSLLDDFDLIDGMASASSWDSLATAGHTVHVATPAQQALDGAAGVDVVDTLEALLRQQQTNPIVRHAHFLAVRPKTAPAEGTQPSSEAKAEEDEKATAQRADRAMVMLVESQQLEDRPAMHLVGTVVFVLDGEDADAFVAPPPQTSPLAAAPGGYDAERRDRRAALLATMRAVTTYDDTTTKCLIAVNIRRRRQAAALALAASALAVGPAALPASDKDSDSDLSDFDLIESFQHPNAADVPDMPVPTTQEPRETAAPGDAATADLVPLAELQERLSRLWRVPAANIFAFDFQRSLAHAMLLERWAGTDTASGVTLDPEFLRLRGTVAGHQLAAAERHRAKLAAVAEAKARQSIVSGTADAAPSSAAESQTKQTDMTTASTSVFAVASEPSSVLAVAEPEPAAAPVAVASMVSVVGTSAMAHRAPPAAAPLPYIPKCTQPSPPSDELAAAQQYVPAAVRDAPAASLRLTLQLAQDSKEQAEIAARMAQTHRETVNAAAAAAKELGEAAALCLQRAASATPPASSAPYVPKVLRPPASE